jgi:hypothetical protein
VQHLGILEPATCSLASWATGETYPVSGEPTTPENMSLVPGCRDTVFLGWPRRGLRGASRRIQTTNREVQAQAGDLWSASMPRNPQRSPHTQNQGVASGSPPSSSPLPPPPHHVFDLSPAIGGEASPASLAASRQLVKRKQAQASTS